MFAGLDILAESVAPAASAVLVAQCARVAVVEPDASVVEQVALLAVPEDTLVVAFALSVELQVVWHVRGEQLFVYVVVFAVQQILVH